MQEWMETKSCQEMKTYRHRQLKGHCFNGYPPKALSSAYTAISLKTWNGANKWSPWNAFFFWQVHEMKIKPKEH